MELLPEAYGAHANNYTTFESEINDTGKPNQVDAHEENSPMAFGFGMAKYFIAHAICDFVSENDANRRLLFVEGGWCGEVTRNFPHQGKYIMSKWCHVGDEWNVCYRFSPAWNRH